MRRTTLAAYAALLLATVVWELWWAPATPVARFFWIALKALPLLAALPWLLRGRAAAHIAASLLVMLYFCDGTALAYVAIKSGDEASLLFAAAEIALALLFVVTASIYARLSFRTLAARAGARTGS